MKREVKRGRKGGIKKWRRGKKGKGRNSGKEPEKGKKQ